MLLDKEDLKPKDYPKVNYDLSDWFEIQTSIFHSEPLKLFLSVGFKTMRTQHQNLIKELENKNNRHIIILS